MGGGVIVDSEMLGDVRGIAERDAAARAIRAALGPHLDPRAVRARAAAAFAAVAAAGAGGGGGVKAAAGEAGERVAEAAVAAGPGGLGSCFRTLGAEVSEAFLGRVAQAFAAEPGAGVTREEFEDMVFVIYSSRE
jgi:hypothetical protein